MDKPNSAYQLGLYEKSMPSTLTWLEKLQITKDAGFDYLEMSIDETDEKLARLTIPYDKILNAIKETGIPIKSMCLSAHRKYPLGSRDLDIQKRSLNIMEKAINLATNIGVRIIQVAGYDVYYEEGDTDTRKSFEENLNKCVLMAAEKGVLLGFETMETPFMDTVEKAMYYVNKLNNAYLGIYPDIGNLKNASLLYHTDINDDLFAGKGHIFASHLKETLPGVYREVPFGTGHTDFVNNIEALIQMGVRSFVGEFWYIGNENWKKVIVESNIFLRSKLNEGIKRVGC